MHTTRPPTISWDEIKISLGTLQQVEGGYSHARRGIVALSSGERAFVKIGVDDNTKKWAAKEIETYHILADHNYLHIPSLLAVNSDSTAFAIQALPANDHWDWTDTWTEARLAATLRATDNLSEIALSAAQHKYFAVQTINETQDGWRQLVANTNAQGILAEKLQQAGRGDITDTLNISEAANQSAPFRFSQDTLVHNDVRADNCAWNPKSKQIKLVDWNWAQLGDRRIDSGALLVNVQKAGLDVTKHHAERLHKDALHWLAGYWLHAATQPLWPGASEKSTLRDHQLSSGVAALDLIKTLETR